MNNLKFETNEFGIKRCIVNTKHKWVRYTIIEDYDVINYKECNNKLIINTQIDTGSFEEDWKHDETFEAELDFNTKKYYLIDEIEKDQITIYYFPISMLLFGRSNSN